MLLCYGIPEIIISDNGPQYSSQKFADFASLYNFRHVSKAMDKQNVLFKL